jgi:hypothetical protein
MTWKIEKTMVKTKVLNYTTNQLLKFLNNSTSGYEHLTGQVIPYYEFDFVFDTESKQKELESINFKTSLNAVIEKYPHGQLYVLSSNGLDPVKNKWKNSYHIRVRGMGYFTHGKLIPMVDGSDSAPYSTTGKRQLLRLPFMSKESNNRPLVPLLYDDNLKDWLKVSIDQISLEDYLVQNTANEQLIKTSDNTPTPQLKQEDSISAFTNVSIIEKLVDCLDISRLNVYLDWIRLMRCLKNIGLSSGIELVHIAKRVSQKNDKYVEGEVEKFFSRYEVDVKKNKIGIATLCFWAKEDNVEKYNEIRQDSFIQENAMHNEYITQANSVDESSVKYQFSDFKQFQDKDLKTADLLQIYKYLKDSVVHVIDCGSNKIFTVNRLPDGSCKFNLVQKVFFGIDDIKFKIDGKEVLMSTFYMFHYSHHSFDYIDFIPFLKENPCPASVFNLFQGFKIKYNPSFVVDESKIKNILHHIRVIICANNNDHYVYLMKYLRHLFEKPADKIGVALLFQSEKQGTGKNMFLNLIMNILGDDLCYKATRIEDICSKFNYHLQGKLLIQGDEIANFAGFKVADQLKACITETIKPIEPKGKDPYCIKSSERYMLTSNNKFPLRIEESDRRYGLYKVCESMVGNIDYFKQLAMEVESVESQTIFLHYLINNKTFEIDGWNFRNIPDSSYKSELIAEVLENPIEFILSLAQEYEEHDGDNDLCFIVSDMLYSKYVSYCDLGKYKSQNKKQFNKTITSLVDRVRSRGRSNRQRGYYIDSVEIVNKYRLMIRNPNWNLEDLE